MNIENTYEIQELQNMELRKSASDWVDSLKPEELKFILKLLLSDKEKYIGVHGLTYKINEYNKILKR
jgi:hypothetical protein